MEENIERGEGQDGMAEKQRLDLDAMENDLLRDVQEAGRIVQQRKKNDKVAEQKSQDRTLMYAIVVFATIVIFALAYWKTFMAGSAQPQNTGPRVHSVPAPVQQQQMPQRTAPAAVPAPQYNNAPRPEMPTYHPPRVITPSQPTQTGGQVPSENQDEGQSQDGGGM